MKPLAVARRYARALADVAMAKDRSYLEQVSAELSLVAEVLESEPRLMRFFEDPSVRPQDREAAVKTLARRGKIGDLVRRFLEVLIENRRLSALPAIAEAFRAIKDERLGIEPVEATTAVSLTARELGRFREALEVVTGRAVRLTVSVDPSVLGGARTRIGSRVYDGTVRRQLGILRQRLIGAGS